MIASPVGDGDTMRSVHELDRNALPASREASRGLPRDERGGLSKSKERSRGSDFQTFRTSESGIVAILA